VTFVVVFSNPLTTKVTKVHEGNQAEAE
jgi:hypothetical protein